MQRRSFLKAGAAAGAGFVLGQAAPLAAQTGQDPVNTQKLGPIAVSTWRHGVAANRAAIQAMNKGASAMDAAVQGVMVTEADPKVTSVGYGGFPNAEGVVSVDAAVMDGDTLAAGSVAGVEDILHPVAVAQKVMTETPHVMLVGDGARSFALAHGFPKQELLTDEMKKKWQEWKAGKGRPLKTEDNHDTIGMITLDSQGRMAASCTTSGAAWKLPGRVGDSPLIGAGLYCDSEVGGVSATGLGEEIIRVCGSYQVVEFMRQGIEPMEAIRRVMERMTRRRDPKKIPDFYAAFVALRADGMVGYGATGKDFQAAITRGAKEQLLDATPFLEEQR